jgi:hypothetical protein
MAESSRLYAMTTADVFPHTAGWPIVPIVTKTRKQRRGGSSDARIVMSMTM